MCICSVKYLKGIITGYTPRLVSRIIRFIHWTLKLKATRLWKFNIGAFAFQFQWVISGLLYVPCHPLGPHADSQGQRPVVRYCVNKSRRGSKNRNECWMSGARRLRAAPEASGAEQGQTGNTEPASFRARWTLIGWSSFNQTEREWLQWGGWRRRGQRD